VERSDEQLKTESMLIDAKMLQETGQEDAAAQRYSDILARDPGCTAAMYELSRLAAQKGMADSAITLSRRAVEGDRSNVWYALHLATLYRLTNHPKEYIDTWEGIVALRPEVLDYYYELSNAYLLNKDYKNAIAVLNRVEKKVGVTEQVSTQKAKLWTAMGREDKALQEFEALAKAMPQESRYNGILAEAYMADGKYDKAKECYDRVLAANPDDEYIHISLAEYYKATKQPRKAYEELRIAMAQKNLSTSNKLHILTNFYTAEEFYGIYSQYTYDLLEVAMRDCDDSTTFAALYGDVLMRQKKYEEAVHQFTMSLSVDSSKYEIWEALLVAELSSNSDTARMGRDARRASTLFPLHTLPYYIQAIVEHDNGRYERSIELAHHIEKLGFEKGYLEPDVYMLLAECYNRLEDSRSYEYYEKFLKIYPNDAQAMNSYAYRLALDKKDLDRAEQMSRRTIEAEPENPFFLDTYAWILHQMGRDKEARPYIEKALKRDSTSDEVREHYNAIMKGQ
jgi:tetratricopeptide (TPR) repeat protein